MIKEIRMKNCVPYRDDALKNCKKINFIYGPNGSGKSTISNYLDDPDDPRYADCVLDWDSGDRPQILVYNRRFKDRNFSRNTEIQGVFTLGEDTIDAIDHLNDLNARLEDCQNKYNDAVNACTAAAIMGPNALQAFRDTVWNVILRGDGEEFAEAFTGLRKSKERFAAEVLEQYKRYRKQKPAICSLEDLRARRNSLFQKTPELCQPLELPYAFRLAQIGETEADPVFRQVIVGNQDIPIGRLIQTLNNSDWVSQGRRHLTDGDICPFCQQPTITADFRRQLEAFFGGEYEAAMQQLRARKDQYANDTLRLLDELEKLTGDTVKCTIGQLDQEVFSQKCQLLASAFQANMDAIDDKLSEPSRAVSLTDTAPIIAAAVQMIFNANAAIAAHNDMVNDMKNQRARLCEDVWNYCLDRQDSLIHGYLDDIRDIDENYRACRAQRDDLERQKRDLLDQIADTEKTMTSVQPAVDAINQALDTYGFHNFRIAPSPNNSNMYQIQRPDGSLANDTLSEGEETFITFLYYMQLIQGSNSASGVTARKILVIDDPICSLDNTVLFAVSSMVNALLWQTTDVGSPIDQIFILTHNIYFHKEAADAYSLPKKQNAPHFWIIRKRSGESTIEAHEDKNPIMTSYEMLWKELKNENLSVVGLQNIMRRIIENYFHMSVSAAKKKLTEKFTAVEEKMIAKSLFQWTNDGSHSIPDDIYFSSSPEAVARYKDIFKKIFDLNGHGEHYKMMMELKD